MDKETVFIEAIADGYTTCFPTFAYKRGDTGSLKFIKTGPPPDDWRTVVVWDADVESRTHYVDLRNLKIRETSQNQR